MWNFVFLELTNNLHIFQTELAIESKRVMSSWFEHKHRYNWHYFHLFEVRKSYKVSSNSRQDEIVLYISQWKVKHLKSKSVLANVLIFAYILQTKSLAANAFFHLSTIGYKVSYASEKVPKAPSNPTTVTLPTVQR